MSPIAWIVMGVIVTFVWGGFALVLARALRSEARKREQV
jgi:hypothetical protein